MEKKTYSEKLRDPRWQKKRLEVLNHDNFTCQLCFDKETELHIHHLGYVKGREPWEYETAALVTYCKHCHLLIEFLKPIPQVNVIKISKCFDPDGSVLLAAKSDKPLINFFKIKNENDLDYFFTISEEGLSKFLKDLA